MSEQASKLLVENAQPGEARAALKATIPFDDAALAASCRQGDMRAFGALVAKYQDRIYNMIFRMCGNAADAEELAQETFLRALERIEQFRGNSLFYTWLFRVAANLTISHLRRGGRVRFQSLTGPAELEESQAHGLTAEMACRREPGPDDRAMSAETKRRVLLALEELEDEARLIVVLRDIEDMDYNRIADLLDVPIGTVKSRLHRARCSLKDKLKDLID